MKTRCLLLILVLACNWGRDTSAESFLFMGQAEDHALMDTSLSGTGARPYWNWGRLTQIVELDVDAETIHFQDFRFEFSEYKASWESPFAVMELTIDSVLVAAKTTRPIPYSADSQPDTFSFSNLQGHYGEFGDVPISGSYSAWNGDGQTSGSFDLVVSNARLEPRWGHGRFQYNLQEGWLELNNRSNLRYVTEQRLFWATIGDNASDVWLDGFYLDPAVTMRLQLIPEPSSWSLCLSLMVGMGLVFALGRKKRGRCPVE